ncbi:MAG: Mce-associated rane protein [Mycobacterium sp.]|nr:Mce-associated rane protein [Mycobacterium sp.]
MSTAGIEATLQDSCEAPEPVADDAPPDSADAADVPDTTGADDPGPARRRGKRLARILAYGVLPAAAVLLAGAAGYLKWVDGTARDAEAARAQSVQAAVDSTVAMLSYRPDTVEQNLSAARDRMTGAFRDSYTSLTHDVVIPGAKQRHISAVATVPAVASVSATATHAVVLVFVNQATVIGNDPPTDTASSVKVTLEKVHDRWLISQFDPV